MLKKLGIICLFIFFALTVSAAPQPASAQTTRLWNLQDADILSIINEVSAETGKNFIVDPRVTGKISLISSKPIKSDEVYQVFLSVISLLGYSAIENGNMVKIVPNMESSEFASRIASSRAPGQGDEIVVRVIPLENLAANQVIPVIRPMLPQWSNVSAYTPGNVLIVVGRAANLERIVSIIHSIDATASNEIDVIPLHQATASQIANVVTHLQTAARSAGETPQVSIAADERSNSILLSGNKAARLRMRMLITQLDAPAGKSQGNTEVIYLKYLQAKQLAPTLGKIAQNILGKNSLDDTAPNANAGMSAGKEPVSPKILENRTTIQAEPNTNALIITAPPALMRALKTVITRLDVRPAQVLVEAIVVEVDESNLKNMGIQWGSRGNNDLSRLASVNTPTDSAVPDNFPPVGPNVFGIIPNMQIKAVLTMLENTTGANILSTPSVVVLDNQKAALEIGQQVPTQSGAYATTGSTSTVTPFNTIVNQNVTLKLEVTPQINLGDAVRLKISLRNDSLQNPDNPTLNPIINTSRIDNSVIITSGDVVVLGGLMSNSIIESTDGIPIFHNIPVVGKLFEHNVRTLKKKNLMVFIKPNILRNAEQALTATQTKYHETRQSQIDFPENLTPGGVKRDAIVPPFKNDVTLPKPFES